MKNIVNTNQAPAAIGPYAQAVAIDGLIITSGQLPINPATGAFPEGIAEQTRQSLTNVKAILAEAGVSMDQVIKTTVFLSDMNNFGAGSGSSAQGRSGGDRGHCRQVIGTRKVSLLCVPSAPF